MAALEPQFEPVTLLRNARKIARELRANRNGLREIRIAILGGSTSQEIATFLELFLLERGLSPIFWHSEYGKYWEDAVLHREKIADFKPDLTYVHTGVRNIQSWPSFGATEEQTLARVDAEVSRFTQVWDSLAQSVAGAILQNNFDLPDVRLLGNLDSRSPGGACHFVSKLNERLAAEAFLRPAVSISDIHYLSAQIGLCRWHDPARWFSYKLPCSLEGSAGAAHNLATLIGARYGLSKKVLVLDLDNTLWGGVIGDDGVDRIVIGNETAQAEAYTAFQKYCLGLKQRGVVLAVCSKNNEDIALGGLKHPDSVLQIGDIACFKANWEPKHENLKAISEELNLGLDSFVFVDDNPAERALVSGQLPMVAVPEIGLDVAEYARILDRHQYFELVALSADDLGRGEQYQAKAEAARTQAAFANYDEYLQSLAMTGEIAPFSPTYLDRIAQLTNKTNQFNLTTKRYSAAEISHFTESPDHLTLYVRLSDKFGDHGLISVVIGRREAHTLHLDLWLMSCRVLKRDVEILVLDEIVRRAREMDIRELRGYYFRTQKNDMVSEHYGALGFALVSRTPDGSEWALDIGNYEPRNRNITIHDPATSSREVAAHLS